MFRVLRHRYWLRRYKEISKLWMDKFLSGEYYININEEKIYIEVLTFLEKKGLLNRFGTPPATTLNWNSDVVQRHGGVSLEYDRSKEAIMFRPYGYRDMYYGYKELLWLFSHEREQKEE